jgi:hypothetical protein
MKAIKTTIDEPLISVPLTVLQNSTASKPLVSDSIQGVLFGGIIGFGSELWVDIIKRRLTRLIITINEDTTEVDFYLKKR